MSRFRSFYLWNFAPRVLNGFLLWVLLLPVSSDELIAAANEITEAQTDAESFSRALGRSLELNQGNEIFGMSTEGVSATYLHNQGLLLELRTPLARSRNILNISSLGSRSIVNGVAGNPFSEFSMRNKFPVAETEPTAERDDLDRGLASTEMVERLYDGLTIRMTSIEYSLVVRADELSLWDEVGDLGSQLSQNVEKFQSIEQRAEAGGLSGADLIAETDVVIASMESLKSYSASFAQDLLTRSTEAEKGYNARWDADLKAFEKRMYAGLCEHVGLLSSFSGSEYLTLQVLGVSKNINGFAQDKFYSFGLREARRCADGEIDVEGLGQTVVEYTDVSSLRRW
jgi:hypothetical protein